MENILIVGANGNTGTRIAKLLNDDSSAFHPVAMIRKEEQKAKFEKLGIKTRIGDLEKDLTHVFKDIDRVIFAAGAGGGSSKAKTIIIDQESAKRLIDIAKIKGIKKFVMLSSVGAGHPEDADELQDYLKAKQAADIHLMASGVPYTIIRPGTLKDDGKTGKIDVKKQFEKPGDISRDDVAQALVGALPDTVAHNKTFEIIEGDTKIEEALNMVD